MAESTVGSEVEASPAAADEPEETAASSATDESVVEFEEGVLDLHTLLKTKISFSRFLSLVCLAPAFRASKTTCSLLSRWLMASVSVRVYDSLHEACPVEERIRMQRVRTKLPQSCASGPMHLLIRFSAREVPLRRAGLSRFLMKAVPMIKWEDVRHLRVASHGDMESLDSVLQSNVCALGGADILLLVHTPESPRLRHVERLGISLAQLAILHQEEVVLPRVWRVKVFCEHAELDEDIFEQLQKCFPRVNRLHLVLLPAGLLPLCGPGFEAPRDLRVSLQDGSSTLDRRANVFVASHLFSLPFSWSAVFFRNVLRLQMSEIADDLHGLSLEKFMETVRSLPNLRRLGTVSSRGACLYDISRESCQLEELVLVTELEEVKELFSALLPLEQQKRRTSLRRLAVHLRCSDGAARLHLDVETAICAGWYNIATLLLRPYGWITFSTAAKQLQESVFGQLPWFLPASFCFDFTDYGEVRLPCSTPADRHLPYYSTDGVEQPRGMLVAGGLRRKPPEAGGDPQWTEGAQGGPAATADAGAPVAHTGSDGPLTRRGAPDRTGRMTSRAAAASKEKPYAPDWMDMSLADALEGLAIAAAAAAAAVGVITAPVVTTRRGA